MTTLGELRNKFSAVHKQYNTTAFELSKKQTIQTPSNCTAYVLH